MTNLFSRRDFVRSGALITAAFTASNVLAPAEERAKQAARSAKRAGLPKSTENARARS
jgi:hypothetical protein